MKIELKNVKIRDLIEGFSDNGEQGVISYNGKLDIRPKYQREFVYSSEQQIAVIDTIMKGFPLNVMYWVENKDGFEVLDGQQRTLSICNFSENDFSVKDSNGSPKYFHSLENDIKEKILDYELMIYVCNGRDTEKLEWFRTINIAGEKLTPQELRNAVYTGSWLSDAKRYFSKQNSPAADMSSDYVKVKVNRQELLEKALKWISSNNVEDYMSKHQNDPRANELWLYFASLVNWIKTTFTVVRKKEMVKVDWGELYNKFKDSKLNPDYLECRISELMEDEEVTAKHGIYAYVLTGEEKYLSIRTFDEKQKREAYERQKWICPYCGSSKKYEIEEMEGDHIIPWSKGGKTTSDNCQMLCKKHNREKSSH